MRLFNLGFTRQGNPIYMWHLKHNPVNGTYFKSPLKVCLLLLQLSILTTTTMSFQSSLPLSLFLFPFPSTIMWSHSCSLFTRYYLFTKTNGTLLDLNLQWLDLSIMSNDLSHSTTLTSADIWQIWSTYENVNLI